MRSRLLALTALLAAAMALASGGPAAAQAPAAAADPACGGAAVLVVDAYSADRAATRNALDGLAAASGTQPMFGPTPLRVMEGRLPADHLIAAYKFGCATAATAAMRGAAWERVLATLKPASAQRLTVFMADPGHSEASPRTAACHRPAFFLLKGRVSDAPGYFAYLRALVASGLLQQHGMRREVVMPGREVRLATHGPSFEPGEFFEILRFPCAAQAEAFWDSPAYRELVKLREGRMTAEALLFE